MALDIAASLRTALESLVTAYADACANPKPTYSIEGQSFSWNEYLRMLLEAIKDTQDALNLFDPYWIEGVVIG